VRPYLALLSARYRMLLQYRSAAVAGMATQVFFGFVRVMIFRGFYAAAPGDHPLSLAETTSYIWLSQAFLLVTMAGVDREIEALVRTGHVAHDLARPLDLHAHWLARLVAGRAAPITLRAVPILLFAALAGGLQPPASAGHLALAALSQALGVVLSAAIYTAVTTSLLWTVSGEGVARLAPAVVFFLGGTVIPLPLLPDGCQRLLELLPFRGLIDVPIRTYLGQLAPADIAAGLALQAGWILAFVLLGRWLAARGVHRLVVQGG